MKGTIDLWGVVMKGRRVLDRLKAVLMLMSTNANTTGGSKEQKEITCILPKRFLTLYTHIN